MNNEEMFPCDEYTMTVTRDEYLVIVNSLANLPWKNANPILMKLDGQKKRQDRELMDKSKVKGRKKK